MQRGFFVRCLGQRRLRRNRRCGRCIGARLGWGARFRRGAGLRGGGRSLRRGLGGSVTLPVAALEAADFAAADFVAEALAAGVFAAVVLAAAVLAAATFAAGFTAAVFAAVAATGVAFAAAGFVAVGLLGAGLVTAGLIGAWVAAVCAAAAVFVPGAFVVADFVAASFVAAGFAAVPFPAAGLRTGARFTVGFTELGSTCSGVADSDEVALAGASMLTKIGSSAFGSVNGSCGADGEAGTA